MSLPVSTLLTSEFEEDIRYEVWRESLAPLFFAEAVGDPLQFNGQAKLYLAEDMVFAKTQFEIHPEWSDVLGGQTRLDDDDEDDWDD